ncbi:MAG: coproporphyrinogen dehydrogenase HemZ, partial [Oscillospiraceae bacterium]|nr:coproporphyrinogen dehydrogenase HemZ [Oscillospiraceae bacterium]
MSRDERPGDDAEGGHAPVQHAVSLGEAEAAEAPEALSGARRIAAEVRGRRLCLPGEEPPEGTYKDIDLTGADPGDKNDVKRHIYRALSKETDSDPEWGIMTGVRPVKLVGMLLRREEKTGRDAEEAVAKVLQEEYLLTCEKAAELLDIYRYQQEAVGEAPPDTVGLYLGIPFCPTRCVYCSFPSNQAPAEDIALYLTALRREVEYVGRLMKSLGVRCESVYFGGGTPTTLNAPQLKELLALCDRELPMEGCREFTLEAGRPDTIDVEKLVIAKDHGVTRISINPQTMKDETLQLIGRGHTVAQIYDAFDCAAKAGITDINCDLIAGLPLETFPDFVDSLDKVLALRPTNVTVHTLAVKRGSKLKDADEHYHYKYGERVQQMLAHSRRILGDAGFRPYYLYRQKHMAGSGENTGYCLPGTEGVYNIRIMEERQPIIALGAG